MSLYHETTEILAIPASTGGSLKARIFGKKDHKNPPQRIYALAAETCKWSSILKEIIDNAGILRLERKVSSPFCLA
jgi:25S rRNA (cytosine2278-C5)-methyltransferase